MAPHASPRSRFPPIRPSIRCWTSAPVPSRTASPSRTTSPPTGSSPGDAARTSTPTRTSSCPVSSRVCAGDPAGPGVRLQPPWPLHRRAAAYDCCTGAGAGHLRERSADLRYLRPARTGPPLAGRQRPRCFRRSPALCAAPACTCCAGHARTGCTLAPPFAMAGDPGPRLRPAQLRAGSPPTTGLRRGRRLRRTAARSSRSGIRTGTPTCDCAGGVGGDCRPRRVRVRRPDPATGGSTLPTWSRSTSRSSAPGEASACAMRTATSTAT